MPVIAAFIALVVIVAVLVVVPTIAVAVSRAAVRSVNAAQGQLPVEDAATQERLERIEEAIDAMAAQLERLTQQQQLLISGRGQETPSSPPHHYPEETTE